MAIPQPPPRVHRGFTVKSVEPPQPGYRQIKNKARYTITVTLANGHDATYRCQSKSLKTAFEMIEFMSQQTAGMTDRNTFVDTHCKSMYGKKIWFDLSDAQGGGDIATPYKTDRHGTSLISAFPQKSFNQPLIDELKATAKFYKNRPNNNPNDINVQLNRNNSEIDISLKRAGGPNPINPSHQSGHPQRRQMSSGPVIEDLTKFPGEKDYVNRYVESLESDDEDMSSHRSGKQHVNKKQRKRAKSFHEPREPVIRASNQNVVYHSADSADPDDDEFFRL